jgi:hypothetical protein
MSTLSAATAGPAHRVQSAVEEYGYPQGHLGHLNADQEAAFKNFKLVLEEKGLYKPGTGEEEPGTHDDATLLYESPKISKGCSSLTVSQSLPPGSPLRGSRCIKTVSRHRGLAQGKSVRSTIRNNRSRAIRRDPKTRTLSNTSSPYALLTSGAVPTMDRPTRPPRNPRLRLRS